MGSRSLGSRVALLVVGLGVASCASQGMAHGHGSESAFHSMPVREAPQVAVAAQSDGPVVTLHLETENFTWASGNEVTNFVAGEGIGRVYLDGERVARIYGPEVTLDTRAWNFKPGLHAATVVLTGSDLIAYASDGQEVEVSVPFEVGSEGPPAGGFQSLGSGSAFTVSGRLDSFGGLVFTTESSGLEEAGLTLQFDLDGVPWGRSTQGTLHVYTDTLLPDGWEQIRPLPEVSVSVIDAGGAVMEVDGKPASISFPAPVTAEQVEYAWSSGSPRSIPWTLGLLVASIAGILFAALLFMRRRRHHRAN